MTEIPTREYTGNDPLGFVISLNLHRRHLTESQRAMGAAAIATMTHGGDRRSVQVANWPLDQEQAASMFNVGERSVQTARTVLDKGAPELAQAVSRGDVAVSAAAANVPCATPAPPPLCARKRRHQARELRFEVGDIMPRS